MGPVRTSFLELALRGASPSLTNSKKEVSATHLNKLYYK